MNNPFNPPTANLEREVVQPPKPAAIILATRLFWGTMILSLISLIPGFRLGYWEELADLPIEVLMGILMFFISLFSVLVVHIGKRANWARWSMLVFLVYGWIETATDLPSLLTQGQFAIGAEIAVIAGELYAIKLLFFGEGAQWFKVSQP
jgi:hypothetical protein